MDGPPPPYTPSQVVTPWIALLPILALFGLILSVSRYIVFIAQLTLTSILLILQKLMNLLSKAQELLVHQMLRTRQSQEARS